MEITGAADDQDSQTSADHVFFTHKCSSNIMKKLYSRKLVQENTHLFSRMGSGAEVKNDDPAVSHLTNTNLIKNGGRLTGVI